MEAKKEAKLNMFNTVIALCDGNSAIIALVVAFQNSFNVFKTTVSAITTAAAQLEVPGKGLTVSKKSAKKTLAEFGAGVAGMVFAYASKEEDEELKEEMRISFSDINNAKDDEVGLICGNIYATANGLVAVLGDYGVTAALLLSFNDAIADYGSKAPKPSLNRSQKKAIRQGMNTLFKDADKVLKEQMDKTVVNFKLNGNAEFNGFYEAARVVIDPGTYNTVVRLEVVNKANSMPLRNVRSQHLGSVGSRRSSTKGIVIYKDVAEGNNKFRLRLKGFKDTEAEVMVAHGEKKTVVVQMEVV